ncbi:MAG: hypothetical protein EHM43_06965 [Ignavibacteriae bacterium]|nr:MAG: hypothetical protein EHM43_06965 [Ignavibacteriota bacterium]
MPASIPVWAQTDLSRVLDGSETIRFVGVGRLDAVPPSGLMAMVYWVSYIVTNYAALFVTALFRNRAVVVVTDVRTLIISERAWRFPFWVVPFSRRLLIENITSSHITTLSTVSAKFLWILSANGLQIECESGTARIINGLNAAALTEAQALLK